MANIDTLLSQNKKWAEDIKAKDPDFFNRLSKQQKPEYLWIGCADSRVPANDLVGLLPGELFVHRNIANCVVHTDLNCLSVIFYAVKVLKVKHIMITGHYGCGGVQAAMQTTRLGLIDHWLRNIRDLYLHKRDELSKIEDESARLNRMCELNVIQQISNVTQIPEVQEAWAEGQELTIHGLIYDLTNGLLKHVVDPVSGLDCVRPEYHMLAPVIL